MERVTIDGMTANYVGELERGEPDPGRVREASVYTWERPRPPLTRFIGVSDEGVEFVHEGYGLTLERVVAFEARPEGEDKGMTPGVDPPADIVVYDDRQRARAIITRTAEPGADPVRWLDSEGTDR